MSKMTSALLITLVLFHAGIAHADDTFVFPKTRAGELAKTYIEALNSGDVETLQKFYASYYAEESLAKRPPDERATRALGLHDQMGLLVPALVTDQSESSLTITVQAKKLNMWLSCKFSLEEQQPHKLVSVMIMPGSPPEMGGAGKREWASLEELLEQVCTDAGVPAIAAAVVQEGRVTEVAAVGIRQMETRDEVQVDDGFHIGSITKSVTATMIGRLVEEGKLDWSVTLAQVFGDMDIREEYRNVTLEQLLQHRSGLPGYLTFDDSEGTRLNSLPGTPTEQREAFVAEVLQSDPIAAAGEAMNYSNAGYAVAGLMAERTSGRGWKELVTQYVLSPAGMKNSGVGWPATEARPDQPRGHYQDGSVQGIGEYPLGEFLAPAGDIHASIGDLALYAKMHLDGLAGRDGALKASTIERLHSPPTSQKDDVRYAGGWMILQKEGLGTVHAHSGSAGTFFATVELYPAENRAIVVATNTGAGAGVVEEIIKSINERVKSGAQ
jgi:CubicO group peptidase (beta-lactamase class C family)